MGNRRGIFVSSILLSFTTVLSKILGMVRDIMVAAALGAGPSGGAWVMALLAPNMFRRIFGEGAVGTAMVPMLAESIVKDPSRSYAALQLRTVLLTIAGITLVIMGLGMVLPPLILYEGEMSVTAWLKFSSIPFAMPYVVFICMAGVATAALNVTKNFFLPGLTSVIFNLSTIGLLAWHDWTGRSWDTDYLLMMMCFSVVVSGIIQLGMIIVLLRRAGLLAPRIYWNLPWRKTLRELWSLSLPALIGASVLQLSMTIDWALAAFWLGDYAVGSLSYAEHVAFLPISAVALSLGVVGLSHMTIAYAENNLAEVKSLMNFGLRYVLFLCIPMAVFTCFFAESIVRVLFERGRFGPRDVEETVWALQFLAWGIPAFCMAKISVSGFHSRKDMKTPLKVSLISTGVNLACGLSLMWSMSQAGLAVAMIVSSVVNNVVLLWIFYRQLGGFGFPRVIRTTLRSLICSGIAIFPFWLFWQELPSPTLLSRLSADTVPLLISGAGFITLYAIMAIVLRAEEVGPIIRRIVKRIHPSTPDQNQPRNKPLRPERKGPPRV